MLKHVTLDFPRSVLSLFLEYTKHGNLYNFTFMQTASNYTGTEPKIKVNSFHFHDPKSNNFKFCPTI